MVGVDLISVKRMDRFYEKWGERAYKKFLRPEEIKLVNSPKTAAGFWAVKEAVSKALGCGISKSCTFYDIWIRKNALGKPYISLAFHLIEEFKIEQTSISISHDGDFAIGLAYIKSSCESEVLSH